MNQKLCLIVDAFEQELIEIRRHLHQYPDLSGNEYNTAKFLLKHLDELDVEAKLLDTEAGPGVIAIMKGKEDSPVVAFRADMDALPLMDKKLCSYASKIPGVMHACGHDFNMTCVLGLAKVLNKVKNELEGSVKFIFQPSEESNKGGATHILKSGIMESVDAIWAIHAFPDLPAGSVGIRYGAITSATDAFKLSVKGVSGHSARPHLAVDSIFVASQIINGLYSIIYRKFDPRQPIVISLGTINGGTAPNIVASQVELSGTVRMFDQQIRSQVPEIVSEVSRGIAASYGAKCDVDWHFGPPPVINDQELAKLTQFCAENLLGEDGVAIINRPSMGAEDFSRFLWYAPGMLLRIGTGGEEDVSYPLHSSMFDINEEAIAHSVKLLANVTFSYFELKKTQEEIKRIEN
ncbi:MAG: amidohydrolase [Cyanobacteriota bacterium]